ncbi:hypothetical protein D3C72_1703620 [compost metagenome]
MYSRTPGSSPPSFAAKLVWMPPRPGKAPAGICTDILMGLSTCCKVAWYVRTGVAWPTFCVIFSLSVWLPAFAATSHTTVCAPSGTW